MTLRLTATFSDGTTATAVTVATAIVPTNPPSLALTYNGLLQDRVAPSSLGVAPDGALDGTLTATLGAPFVIAGALKSLYDLGLYTLFRRVPIEEAAS